ncbi:hypothetical protein [Longispora albida]|uniref:hypothetical protein n=1 Tax=Longispora albida TaxID=203523 RepID=UPI00036E543E|nr:hypothetical protein [Longispora albida]
MSLRQESTLAGYARAAVHDKHAMLDASRNPGCRQYLAGFMQLSAEASGAPFSPAAIDAIDRCVVGAWEHGEAYVLAPAMAAVVAAAASALDLTGEIVAFDEAPEPFGVLFLPEPIRLRRPDGRLRTLGAITWSSYGTDTSTSWLLCGWADRSADDPQNIAFAADLAARPDLARQFGPYLLVEIDDLPADRPVPERGLTGHVDEADYDWHTGPDGAVVIDDAGHASGALMALLYSFWRIQSQPLATVEHPHLDRGTRRRAERAGVQHITRVVMLRRTKAISESDDAGPGRRYSVRWIVRGHWRRLTNSEGHRYRIWINAHVKGPDDAPLLGGQKVNVLAR